MKRMGLKLAGATTLAVVLAVAAWAFYTTPGAGSGAGTVGSLTAPSGVTVAPVTSSGSHTVSWTAASVSNAGAASSITYIVERRQGSGSWVAAGGACAGTLQHNTLSCQDSGVADGSYTYRVTAKLSGWTATSDPSNAVQVTTADNTAPSLTSLQMFDVDSDGKVDEVKATFSEPIQSSTNTSSWTLTNVPSGGSLSSVSTGGSEATLSITEGAGAANTAVGSFTVALAASATGIRDATGNQASFAATAPSDKAAPARTRTEMFDQNTNGRIDEVEIDFSESLASHTAGTGVWNLTGTPSGGTLGSVSVTPTTATLNITEGSGAEDTAVGAFQIDLSASGTGIRDAANNQTAFTDAVPSDKAKPVKTKMELFDTSAPLDGKVDQVQVTFSETLVAYSAGTAGWTLANTPGGNSQALTGVTISGATPSVALLTLGQGNNVSINTAAGRWTTSAPFTFSAFTVELAATANGVRDAADNRASFSATNVTDKAAPIPEPGGLTFDPNGNGDNIPNSGDQVFIKFSEQLAVNTLCSSWSTNTNATQSLTTTTFQIENNVAGTGNDRLGVAASGASCATARAFGTLDLGTANWVGLGGAVTTPLGTVDWTFSTRTLRWLLTAPTPAPTADNNNRTATYVPTAGLTDIAGVQAAGSAALTGKHW